MNPKPPLHHSITPPRRAWLLAAILLSGLFALRPSLYAAESPLYIPFQGQVTNQVGTIVADGQYSVIFNLYDQAVGGQPVWSERHVKIGVTRGMINVFLGSISPLTSVDFSQTKYLGITVDTDNLATTADPEMVPRSLIMPAFHAKKAEVATNSTKLAGQDWTAFFVNASSQPSNDPLNGFLNGSKIAAASIGNDQLAGNAVGLSQMQGNSVNSDKIVNGSVELADLAAAVALKLVPPGTIVAFGGNSANVPAGWLLCDGSALRSLDPAHAALFAAIGQNWGNGTTTPTGALIPAVTIAPNQTDFNVPDLRGYFLRGVDGVIGRDPDKLTRTSILTGGASGNAVGSVQVDELKSHTHQYLDRYLLGSGDTAEQSGADYGQQNVTRTTEPTGGAETRPKNAYVNYIIKY
jgi:microcystin-dependent protein